MKLAITKQATKFVQGLPSKQFKQVMGKILDLLKNPLPNDHKKLKGYDYLAVGISEYRIIYKSNEDVLSIIVAAKRNDDEVYTMLKRLN